MNDIYAKKIKDLKKRELYRSLRSITHYEDIYFKSDGQRFLNFGSNSYLQLSNHPDIVKTLKKSADRWGVGSQSSRYISGNHESYDRLEKTSSQWLKADDCLVFSSAYMANLGVLSSFLNKKSFVLMDRSCHASLYDGVRLSDASYRVFHHNDSEHLEFCLKKYACSDRKLWILLESIYSMDGDLCPLKDIVSLKNRYDFHILLDESHSLGILGDAGEGLASHLGLEKFIDLRVCGLGKAVGLSGGLVLGSSSMIDWLRNRARTSIYTPALPIPLIESIITAIELVKHSEDKRRHLSVLIDFLGGRSPIIPWVINGSKNVLDLAQIFFNHNIFIPAIRYPTVSRNQERLRISLTSGHTKEQLSFLKKIWNNIKKN